ncbi:MAG: thiamine-phosphate kinase [Candidatus Bathyarchaeales archaeon]
MGERKVIETIFHRLALPNMPIPFGDDVAGVDIGRGKVAVLKTDMFVGKTDMPPTMNFWQAARKAVVMNVSDFSVKGVKPTALLVSLGVPPDFLKADVEQLAEGLDAGAREYGAYVIGGDTNEASDLIISCSLFGVANKRFLMLRGGAEAGDIVAVTGFFGRTSAGLKVLLEGLAGSSRIKRFLLEAVLLPKARLKEGLALATTGAVSASIDSSDGLAWSLYELKKASGTGFLIDNLPVAPEVLEFAKRNRIDPKPLALYGGEEYELVVTIKPKLWKKAVAAVNRVGGALIKIGTATKDADVNLRLKGKTVPIEPKGWEHFKSKG